MASTWLTGHATPNAAYWGLVHADDLTQNRANRVTACWQALQTGTVGQLWMVHWTCDASNDCDPHGSPANDEARFGDLWEDMLGTP